MVPASSLSGVPEALNMNTVRKGGLQEIGRNVSGSISLLICSADFNNACMPFFFF